MITRVWPPEYIDGIITVDWNTDDDVKHSVPFTNEQEAWEFWKQLLEEMDAN